MGPSCNDQYGHRHSATVGYSCGNPNPLGPSSRNLPDRMEELHGCKERFFRFSGKRGEGHGTAPKGQMRRVPFEAPSDRQVPSLDVRFVLVLVPRPSLGTILLSLTAVGTQEEFWTGHAPANDMLARQGHARANEATRRGRKGASSPLAWVVDEAHTLTGGKGG